MRTRDALLVFASLELLSGCATMAVGVSPPGLDEFPQQELPFRVAGTQETVLRDIQDYLARRGLPSLVTVRAPRTFVVTTYIEEPSKAEDRRIRRTAFRLGLESAGSAQCTSVAVVMLTKSRGVREEVWTVQESDTTFQPRGWPEIKALLDEKACK